MVRKRTRTAKKQQLAAKLPLTRDYQPIMVHHWGVRPRDLPLFTFLSVQAMLYDPTIRLGLAMRAAPVYQTEFGYKQEGQWTPGVEAKNEAVGEFVYRQLQRIWQQDIGALVKGQLWGHAAGEVLLRLTENNMVEVDRLLERHPNDVRALKRAGQNVGIRISRLTRTGQGNVDLEWPKGYWTTFNAEAGTFYGTSILLGAYSPWYDKWCDGGALDVRRLYMHKDAYVGCSIYYPEGDLYVMPDGSEVPARDLARQMIEQIVAGGVVALPSDTDERGNKKWELKPAAVASNPAHILKYPQDLDTEMLRGLEVPDDIFTADSTSSGAWAGKKVPLSAFYAGIDIWVVQLIKDLCRCIFEPLVLLNFGKAEEFQIAHKPLAQQSMEQQNQPQGQPQGQPGEQPGGGGMADLFGGMGGGEEQPGGEGEQAEGGTPSLADLLGSPAAQQARQGGGQAMQMSLDAAIGRGVVDAAKIVVASRAQVDAALVRMAGDTNPWQPYKGPRGGTGWIHSGTGVVAYQVDQPGAHETEGSDEGKPKEVAAKHDAGRGVRTGGTGTNPERFARTKASAKEKEGFHDWEGRVRGAAVFSGIFNSTVVPEQMQGTVDDICEELGIKSVRVERAKTDSLWTPGGSQRAIAEYDSAIRDTDQAILRVANKDIPLWVVVHELAHHVEHEVMGRTQPHSVMGGRGTGPRHGTGFNKAFRLAADAALRAAGSDLTLQGHQKDFERRREESLRKPRVPSVFQEAAEDADSPSVHDIAATSNQASNNEEANKTTIDDLNEEEGQIVAKAVGDEVLWMATKLVSWSDRAISVRDKFRDNFSDATNEALEDWEKNGSPMPVVTMTNLANGKKYRHDGNRFLDWLHSYFGVKSRFGETESDAANQGASDPDIRMSHNDNPWTPFPGPRGGHRWRNTETGSVRYQKERPAASDTGDEPEPTQAKVSNESHVAAVQQGDTAAAERLLKQNGGLIYSMARKFAKNHDELEDYQQEARIAVLHAAKAFDPSKGFQFSTLATRAIINRLTNVSGKTQKRKSVWTQLQEDEDGHSVEPSVQPDPLPMEDKERQQSVLKAIQSLPERAREIVQRRYGLDGEPPESASDIGRRVGLSPQRVAKILDDARGKLRRSLEDYSIQLAIRMAGGDTNPWQPYKGPRGGTGWTHGGTGDVRYQTERPGADETGGSEKAELPDKPVRKTKEERAAESAARFEELMNEKSPEDAEAFRRAKADGVAIPPAWTGVAYHGVDKDVWAEGRDSKGRRQRVENPEYRTRVSRENNARISRDLLPKFGTIKEELKRDAEGGNEEAKVLYLIAQTGFRIGGAGDGKAKAKAFGASTLLGDHVKVDGDKVTFDFPGKKGVRQVHEITDPLIARMMESAKPGELVFKTRDAKVREAWQQEYGGHKVHDIRHVIATREAEKRLSELIPPPPSTKKELKAVVAEAAKAAAHKLGNKPSEALKTYIDPRVFEELRVSA